MEKASLFSRHSELQQLIHAKEQSMKISGNPIRENSPPSLQLLLKKKKKFDIHQGQAQRSRQKMQRET